ncbi:MAG: hypothetical protein WA776_16680 [Xanthobacteraceae bacterium]
MHKTLTKTTLYGAIAAAGLFAATAPSFAVEPGDFQATLRGSTIGIPAGALPPPGLYGGLETFVGPNGVGKGQNSAAEGANGGNGLTVFGEAIAPSLLWSTGWNLFGGNVGFVVVQPFFTVAGLQTNCTATVAGCVGSPPIAFGAGAGAFFENVHNTVWQAIDSWNWKNGWFTSLGFALQGPDGSQYNGTLNQDYWTFSPTAAVSYIDKNWKNSINFEYDIHTASKGHTGSYAAVAFNVPGAPAFVAPNGCVGFQCAGSGYTTGDQLFIDWNVLYRYGKLEFGPVGYLKFQTTADSPGSGYTCATLAATYGQSLGCGRAEDIALGGEIGYDFGPAELEVWATDSVYTKDDFSGASVFTRLSFKLEDPSPKPAATAPMVSKSH